MRRFGFGLAWVSIAVFAAPMSGAAGSFSLDSVVLNQSIRAALGGGLFQGGTACSIAEGASFSEGPCHAEYDYNDAFPAAIPVYGGAGASVTSAGGANSVEAAAWGGTTIEHPTEMDVEFFGPGTFLRGRMEAVVSLRDSQPDQYHTWADASMTVHDWFDVTVPTDQLLYFKLRVIAGGSRLTTEQDQRFTITSLADSQVLYERSQDAFTYEEFDLSAWAGQQLRFEFEATVAEHGDAGFGNGATNFLTFFTLSGGYFRFGSCPFPNPERCRCSPSESPRSRRCGGRHAPDLRSRETLPARSKR